MSKSSRQRNQKHGVRYDGRYAGDGDGALANVFGGGSAHVDSSEYSTKRRGGNGDRGGGGDRGGDRGGGGGGGGKEEDGWWRLFLFNPIIMGLACAALGGGIWKYDESEKERKRKVCSTCGEAMELVWIPHPRSCTCKMCAAAKGGATDGGGDGIVCSSPAVVMRILTAGGAGGGGGADKTAGGGVHGKGEDTWAERMNQERREEGVRRRHVHYTIIVFSVWHHSRVH